MPSSSSSCFRFINFILLKKRYARHFHISCFKSNRKFSALHFQRSNHDESDHLVLLRYLHERKLQEAHNLLGNMLQRGRAHAGVVHCTSILTNYARNGFINEAESLFEIMPERNLVTYNAMLSAYVQSGRVEDASRFFEEMPERNVVSWTSMLCGLMNSGRTSDAKSLFDDMPDRNIVSWNSMIVGLIRNGDLMEARKVFDLMPVRDQISWNAMIAGYAENDRMEEARALFDSVPEANVVTWTSLVAGYCRAGDVKEGYRIFWRMPDKNIVSWTAMIGGFTWNGFYEEALSLYLEMIEISDMRPNGETLVSLIYACSGLGFHCLGKQLHAYLILTGWDHNGCDGRLAKSLIHMYSEFGIMDWAYYIYNKNTKNCVVQSCNSLINGYIGIGLLEKARHFFDTLTNRDMISWTLMISGYFDVGEVRQACCLFENMPERDDVAWTVMISGHVKNELFTEAIYFFSKMRLDGHWPLSSTYSTLLGAAGATASLDQGKQFHCLLMKTKYELDIILENSLISMYAKCGAIEDAQHIFSNMSFRDTISWNSMIMGLSHHGLASQALKLFDTMQDMGTRLDSVTFLGVMAACSHGGMVNRGWELFNSMSQDYGIQPGTEHYVCMVDLLGRAGRVQEAEEFVLRLPFKPGLAIWGALLGICRLGEMNTETIARRAALQVLELDPTNAPAHVLLCNIYAAIGWRSEEEMMRKTMGLKGVKKVPGCSWIMLNGRVHAFLSRDRSHPQADELLPISSGEC